MLGLHKNVHIEKFPDKATVYFYVEQLGEAHRSRLLGE